MCSRHVREGGGELAAGQCAAGSCCVVAHGAVHAEELAAFCSVALGVQEVLFGDGRARPEGSDVSGQLVGLFVVELCGLLVSLRAIHLHGHAPGAYLEVNGGSTDAYKRGSVLGSARTHAVAGGAVGGEKLAAFF